MSWDFSTEPDFEELLDWTREFVNTKVVRLDLLWPHDVYRPLTDEQRAIVAPLKQEVRDKNLWACHLGPELGGQGYGQLKLALLNEILGRLDLGASDLRDAGARHRQCGDHRPLRHS